VGLEEARALALRVLAFHARTEAQVRRRLDQAGHAAHQDEVVAWLLRLGYLDDAAWARATARSLTRPGRLGPAAAERRLVAAGIPPEVAHQEVEEALRRAARAGSGEPAEVALCRALAAKRAGAVAPAALPDRERARLARFLLGRGFSGEAIQRVLGLWADGGADAGG
jgi:regulatory protein